VRLLRVYSDSSVIGGCRDIEFEDDSVRLIGWARQRELTLLISEVTLRELEAAPSAVREILSGIPLDCWEFVPLTTEILALRDAYIRAGVVGPQWLNDAAHVATATVAQADAIVSWNFKHIVRLEKIKGYNWVNESLGYRSLTIITPREVRLDESDD
jgi:predicted nucleic acid-binding protein